MGADTERFRLRYLGARGERIAHRRELRQLGAHGVALDGRALQLVRKLGDGKPEIGAGLTLERQEVGEFADLTLQPRQGLVPSAQQLIEEELGQHEDGEQENDHHQKRRQGIDEAGPDIGRSA